MLHCPVTITQGFARRGCDTLSGRAGGSIRTILSCMRSRILIPGEISRLHLVSVRVVGIFPHRTPRPLAPYFVEGSGS